MTTQKGQLLLISGESATGKSASLMNIPNQSRWLYLNTESGKALPFSNKFVAKTVTDPYQLDEAFDHISENPDFDGIIIDSVTFLMDMFESLHVVTAKDSRAAWGDYGQYFKMLMQQWVPRATDSGKHVLVLGHTRTEQDAQLIDRTSVPIKGSLKNNGVEAYFTTVISTKKMPVKALEKYDSDLLTVTEEDEALGFKYVFQTKLTKETVGERIRGPMGLFSTKQTYTNNDAALVLDHMIKYYS